MKKYLLLFCSLSIIGVAGQKYYAKISNTKVNSERKEVALNFAKAYLEKCEKKDYTPFQDFNITGRVQYSLNQNFEKSCQQINENLGKIEIKNLEAAYLQKYTKDLDPIDLMVFTMTSEKVQKPLFVNVWIYHDKNFISGINFSERNYSIDVKK